MSDEMDMDLSELETNAPKKSKKDLIVISGAFLIGFIGVGLGAMNYMSLSQFQYNAGGFFNKAKAEIQTLKLDMDEVRNAEPQFDPSAITQTLEAKIETARQQDKRALFNYVDAQFEEKLSNLPMQQELSEEKVAQLINKMTAKSVSADKKQYLLLSNKLNETARKSDNLQVEMQQMRDEFANAKTRLAAVSHFGTGEVNAPKRLPEFSLMNVINSGSEDIAVIEAPKRGERINSITLVKGEHFKSKLGSHVVKDIIDENGQKMVITNDGYFIDFERTELSPQQLAAIEKKKQQSRTAVQSKTLIAKKKTKLAIPDWTVITHKPEDNETIVLNTTTGATAVLKPNQINQALKSYGKVVSANNATGQVEFDGYYIEGLKYN